MAQITASVVLYRTPESQLTRLLDCIDRSGLAIHVYLIDNSPDPVDSPCFHRPSVTYVRSAENKGYGAGHNIAFRHLPQDAEFHFVLNSDIYFGPSELGRLLAFMRSESEIGQLMPQIIYPDGSIQHLCKLVPNPADLFLRRFAAGPLRSLLRSQLERFELRFTGYRAVMDIPYLSGCFMLLRMNAARQIGGFDERFFLYLEDVDFSRRMHAAFRTVFYPGATVVHDHARDSYRSLRALGMHMRSSIQYFNKWGWLFDRQRRAINRETLMRLEGGSSTADTARTASDHLQAEG